MKCLIYGVTPPVKRSLAGKMYAQNSEKINGALVGDQALGIFATVCADFAFIGASRIGR